jgi:hypothetical protein
VLALMIALVGCGGDDGDGSATFGATLGPSPTGGADDGSTSHMADDGPESASSTAATAGDDTSDDSTGEPLPPFSCDQVAADSPVLQGEFLFAPADPHPGDTLTVIVRSTNGTGRADAPPMQLVATGGAGEVSYDPQTIQGGDALYYYAIPDVALGDICLLSRIDGAPEASAKITVTPRPDPVPGDVFKVVANHQWTCAEEPSFGNELDVYVRDENGVGIPGAVVDIRLSDTADPDTVYNGDTETVPTQIVTDDSGYAKVYNYWPITEHGLAVFELSVAGAPSDIATEITTGWWEDDNMGCSYCGQATVNVWGHWSYTVEFQRDPTATEICVVDNDHAGMGACGPIHIHHAPGQPACWPAA